MLSPSNSKQSKIDTEDAHPTVESYSEEEQAVQNKNKQVSFHDEDNIGIAIPSYSVIDLVNRLVKDETKQQAEDKDDHSVINLINRLVKDKIKQQVEDKDDNSVIDLTIRLQQVEDKDDHSVIKDKIKQQVEDKDDNSVIDLTIRLEKDKIKQQVEDKDGRGKPKIVTDFTNVIKEVKGLPPPPPPHLVRGQLFRGFTEMEEDPENEHFKHYMQLLAESKGYYTPNVPDGVKIACFRPAPIQPYVFDELKLDAKNALDWYNNEKKGDEIYEFVRLECASQYPLCGITYLIAFIARGVDSGCEVPFRAKVCFRVGGRITVESCERVAESSAKFAQLRGKCC